MRELKDMVKSMSQGRHRGCFWKCRLLQGISEQEAGVSALLHDGVSCGRVCGQSLYRFMGTFK